MADVAAREIRAPVPARPLSLHKFARRKSTIAFLMALPLIVVVACLVIYPAFYSMHLATLNKSMTKFRGIGPVYAKRLVRAFGEAAFAIIEQQPDRRRKEPGSAPSGRG